jgi:hypothetical protein
MTINIVMIFEKNFLRFGDQIQVSHMPGKFSTIELHPLPLVFGDRVWLCSPGWAQTLDHPLSLQSARIIGV